MTRICSTRCAPVVLKALALLTCLSLAAALPALAADPPQQAAKGADAKANPQDPQDPQKAEMDAYMKLAQPGEHHKMLGRIAGKWKTEGQMFNPGQPPMTMTGTMEATWMLGGRYLQEVHTGSFMGMPFEGRGLDGYDNVAKEYFSTWVDSMGTGVEIFHGQCDDPCKVLTQTAEYPDPMTGKVVKAKTVTTYVDNDTYRFEMYMVGAGKDGQDAKVMDMTGKRVK